MTDIAALKRAVDLRDLIGETHLLARSGKVSCPFHDDVHPSCHVYRDGFKCFGCGAYGDHLDWLEHVHGLGTSAAIERLQSWARTLPAPPRLPGRTRRRLRDTRTTPLSGAALQAYRKRLEATRRLPGALRNRGLSLADALGLGLAAIGEDALLPIHGPDGSVLAIKRRVCGRTRNRYLYTSSGHGSPAWCSPGLGNLPLLLVIEGELNGMVAHLALREAGFRIGVMAAAGASGSLHGRVLGGRDVFIYADPDPSGDRARVRWQAAARRAGSATVRRLPPFAADACDLAGAEGRPRLARRLIAAMFQPPRASCARAAIPSEAYDDAGGDLHPLSTVPR